MTLSAGQEGPIHFYVVEGSDVSRGEKLFGIDPKELKLRQQLAKLQWIQSKAKLRKIKTPLTKEEIKRAKLTFSQQKAQYQSGGISEDAYQIARLEYLLATRQGRPEDINIAKLDVDLKFVQLKLADSDLEKAFVKAPAVGQINRLLVQPNEWVKPGQEVLELLNIHPLYIVLNVPLEQVPKLHLTDSLPISVFVSDEISQVSGKIKFISNEVDAVSQTIRVRLEINNEKQLFKPGMRAQVDLP